MERDGKHLCLRTDHQPALCTSPTWRFTPVSDSEKDILQLTYDHTGWRKCWHPKCRMEYSQPPPPVGSCAQPLPRIKRTHPGGLAHARRHTAGEKQGTSQLGLELKAGDILALTSDGISDLLTDTRSKPA
jgi:hypothetical protein